MADNRYGDPRGSAWSDRDRERSSDDERSWRDADRARPGWGSSDDRSPRGRFEDDGRGNSGGGGGFFERAGEQVRSWFGGDDDDDDRSFGQGRGQRPFDHGAGGFRSGSDRWSGPPAGRERFGERGAERDQDWRGGQRGSSGQSFGYNEMGGSMGGFGNQRFASGQDDHYLSWRNRQLEQLDRDYQEFCRENEQKFHQNFDSWRQKRQASQGQPNQGQPNQGQSGQQFGQQSPGGGMSASGGTGSTSTSTATSGSAADSSFIGSGSDPSAATAGGGGDPTPEPTSPGSTRSRTRG